MRLDILFFLQPIDFLLVELFIYHVEHLLPHAVKCSQKTKIQTKGEGVWKRKCNVLREDFFVVGVVSSLGA